MKTQRVTPADILAAKIVEDLQAALHKFSLIAADLTK
jgi:hypothetical protein